MEPAFTKRLILRLVATSFRNKKKRIIIESAIITCSKKIKFRPSLSRAIMECMQSNRKGEATKYEMWPDVKRETETVCKLRV